MVNNKPINISNRYKSIQILYKTYYLYNIMYAVVEYDEGIYFDIKQN